MIISQIVLGIFAMIIGFIFSIFAKPLSRHLPMKVRNSFKRSRITGKHVQWFSPLSNFYGDDKAARIFLLVFGLIPFILGLIILTTGLLGINIWTD